MSADMIATYVIGLLLTAFLGGAWAWFGSVNKQERRTAARIALLSPLWPVMLAVGFGIGARRLWGWAADHG